MKFESPHPFSPEREVGIEKKENINKANNFSELYKILEEIGGLQSSDIFYDSNDLIDRIEKVREGKFGINVITRTEGLRKKVEELLSKENVDGKFTFENIEKALQRGEKIKVKVKRRKGQIEDGWRIDYIVDENSCMVIKDEYEYKKEESASKIISFEELQELNG